MYRKNSKAKVARSGWPHSDHIVRAAPSDWPPRERPAVSHSPDDIDRQVQGMEDRLATDRRIGEAVGTFVFLAFVVVLTVGVVLGYERNEARQRECVESGGAVIDVHRSGEFGSWVCIPADRD